MSLIPKEFLNSVVYISAKGKNLEFATGFFVSRKIDAKIGSLYLITNKHVIDNKQEIFIRIKNKESNIFEDVKIPLISGKNEHLFYLHSNKNIDIAVIPMNQNILNENTYELSFYDIDENAITSKELFKNEMTEGSLIYMLGYPFGLKDKYSLKPIVKLGSIARMSEELINNEHIIVADIHNFPGNSGSPIFIRPEIMSLVNSKTIERTALIGIITNYIKFQNKIINENDETTDSYTYENSDLAMFIPIEYIIEVLNLIQPKFTTN